MRFTARREIAVVVAFLVGLAPTCTGRAHAIESECEEYYRRVIRAEVSRGDSLGVIYRDGTRIAGKFWGLSGDGSAVWLETGSHLNRERSEHSLESIHALRYRDIAGARPWTVAKWGMAGAMLGSMAMLGLLIGATSGSSEGPIGVSLLIFPGLPLVAGACGIMVGASRPRSGSASETVRCGTE